MKKLNILFSLNLFFLSALFLSLSAQASTQNFELSAPNTVNHSQIQFTLGYTLGTHHGRVNDATGMVTMESGNPETLKGGFQVSIHEMTTGNIASRDCHMRESLGLNYQLANYPSQRACSFTGYMPVSGNKSIKYPLIKFDLEKVVMITSKEEFARTHKAKIQAHGTWEIHGQKFSTNHPLSVELADDGGALLVKGNFDIQFSDFGIISKPVSVLGFTVSVEEFAKVKLNLVLNHVR